MKITPIEHGLDLLSQPNSQRSGGLHISDIYGDLYSDLEPTRFVRGSPMPAVKMAMGLAWESYLELQLQQHGIRAERPGEFLTSEGIAYSPDLIIDNGHPRIGEIKLTYMSSRDDITSPKFAKWMTQVKAYGHQLRIPRARFYVLYVNGNYREQREPDLQAIDVEFSRRELEDNWSMLINHAQSKGMLT
jgi:hypothetical protein